MKDLKLIEELLEKYYRAETSTSEEDVLQKFFSQPELPEHLQAEAEIFAYFGREKESPLSGEMEKQLDKLIADSAHKPLARGMNLRYLWIGAAAVILILIGIFLDSRIQENSVLEVRQDTFKDPYIAYSEAKKVLYMVSEKMNTARKPLKNIKKLDAGVNYMHPVFSFGAGIQHLEHFSTIEKTRKKISK
jgi:hypothetical protein